MSCCACSIDNNALKTVYRVNFRTVLRVRWTSGLPNVRNLTANCSWEGVTNGNHSAQVSSLEQLLLRTAFENIFIL